MIRKVDQRRMKDYLVTKLEKCYPKLDVRNKKIIGDIESNYVFVNPTEVVFLLDKEYPKKSFEKIYNIFYQRGVEIAPVFFKDGKTFFRSAAQKNFFKRNKGFSLKHYSPLDLQKMILFRPEEQFVNSRRQYLQYYQTNSPRLEEGIETFEFKDVKFDYSHIDRDKFKPHNISSKRLHIWIKRLHRNEDLFFKGGYLSKIY